MKKFIFNWFLAFLSISLLCYVHSVYQEYQKKKNPIHLRIDSLRSNYNNAYSNMESIEKKRKEYDDALKEREKEISDAPWYSRYYKKISYWYSYTIGQGKAEAERLDDQFNNAKEAVERVGNDLLATENEISTESKNLLKILCDFPILVKSLFLGLQYTFLLFVGYYLFGKIFLYYGVAPILQRRSLSLGDENMYYDWKNSESCQQLRIGDAGERVVVKGEEFHSKYNQDGIKKKTRWLLSRRYFLMSFFVGWDVCTVFYPKSDDKAVGLHVSHPDPNRYFIKIHLNEDKPVFVNPRALVAYTGNLKIRAQWHPFNIVAWLQGRIRYFCFSGNGALVLQGSGQLVNHNVQAKTGHSIVLRHNTAVAVSSNMKFSVQRNETFMPFCLGEASLFDDRLAGDGSVIQITGDSGRTKLAVARDSVWTIIGKFLGF